VPVSSDFRVRAAGTIRFRLLRQGRRFTLYMQRSVVTILCKSARILLIKQPCCLAILVGSFLCKELISFSQLSDSLRLAPPSSITEYLLRKNGKSQVHSDFLVYPNLVGPRHHRATIHPTSNSSVIAQQPSNWRHHHYCSTSYHYYPSFSCTSFTLPLVPIEAFCQ